MDDNQEALAQSEHDKSTCPYCKKSDSSLEGALPESSLESCPYCADVKAPEASECPYCAAMESNDTGGCQYCAAMEAGPQTDLPTTTDSQDYAGQDLDEPAIPKPMPGDEPPIEQGVSQDGPTVNNTILGESPQGDPNEKIPEESLQLDQSKEAMQEIARQIEADGKPQEVSADAAAVVDPHMEGNVSRPENYDQNIPGDMGLAEEEPAPDGPDLTEVLHEGLDSHSDSIQREKVVQKVAQALEGFKASKHIIERAQIEAPQLYQASIAMLSAMIEMCHMLGLGAEGASPADPLQDEWQDPFPLHPDKGGEQKPTHAPGPGSASQDGDENNGNEWADPFPQHPDKGGAVGQPIGKLPHSATTPHVARTPQLPGAVNTKGQKKVIDPETGETRWIDMKEGRVQSQEGIPIKPPKQGSNGSEN